LRSISLIARREPPQYLPWSGLASQRKDYAGFGEAPKSGDWHWLLLARSVACINPSPYAIRCAKACFRQSSAQTILFRSMTHETTLTPKRAVVLGQLVVNVPVLAIIVPRIFHRPSFYGAVSGHLRRSHRHCPRLVLVVINGPTLARMGESSGGRRGSDATPCTSYRPCLAKRVFIRKNGISLAKT